MDENKKANIVRGYEVAKLVEQVEPPLLPPAGFISPFKTFQEWLLNICDTEPPEKPISEYEFLLFDSPTGKGLSFTGQNTYSSLDKSVITRRIEFKPSNMFFIFDEDEYRNLTFDHLHMRVVNDLVAFTKTTKFNSSYLSKAESITTNFSTVWSRT